MNGWIHDIDSATDFYDRVPPFVAVAIAIAAFVLEIVT
jgi:hypothetical protein